MYHSPQFIEDAFKTCTILHNMVLAYDGRDNFGVWEAVDWETLHPDMVGLDEDDEDVLDDHSQTPVPNISGVTNYGDYSPIRPNREIKVIKTNHNKREFKVTFISKCINQM